MVWLVSAILGLSLLNLAFLGVLFRALVVTNIKIEDDLVYKKQINDKLNVINDITEVNKKQSIIIELLNKIVTLL